MYVVRLVSFYGRITVHCTYQIGYAPPIYFRDQFQRNIKLFQIPVLR